MRLIIQLGLESGPIGLDTGIALHIVIYISRSIGSQVTYCLYSWFSEQVGLAGDLGSISDVLIPWVKIWTSGLLVYKEPLSIARPKIDDKAHFELKGQFLKELPDNTFSGSDNEDANEHIEKVLRIVDLFHIPEVTQDQIMLRVFPMSLTGAASRWLRNEPFGSIITWKILKKKFLSKYCPPARTAKKMEEINNFQQEPDETLYQAWERQIFDSKGAIPTMKATDAKKAIQDMADHSQKWHNGTSTRTRSIDTSDGLFAIQAQLNNLGREIKKVNKRVYAAQVGCESCNGTHYTKDYSLKEEGKTFEEAYYTQFGVPFPQGERYKAAALGFYQRDNGNPLYQERRQTMEESLSKFMAESAKRHDENSNSIKEIRAAMDATIRNQGASIKALEIQIRQMSKVLQEMGSGSLPSSTEINPRDHVKSISTTAETKTPSIRRIKPIYEEKETLKRLLMEKPRIGYRIEASMNVHDSAILEDSLPLKEKDLGSLGELAPTKLIVKLADRTIKRPKGIVENVLVGIDKFVFPVDLVVLDMPEDIKVPLILERPFLSTTHTKIDVFKRKITLRVRDDKIMFKSDKPTSNIIKRVYALQQRERIELDLQARLLGEALILNRSLDPTYGDYIKLNDLNKPLELRRNHVEDLGPTIKDGELIDKPMIEVTKTRNANEEIEGIDEYLNFCDIDRKIHIDCAYNLQFSCMIGSGYQQKDRKPSQNDKTKHGMEKTVQNQGQSPKMPKSESILRTAVRNRVVYFRD
ncbi:DNA-directed DNA polymerase [Tanacetum coccineum]